MTEQKVFQWVDVSYSVQQHFYSKPVRLIADFNLSLPLGSSLGLIGPNGAGKTTTLKLGAGLLVPQSGTAQLSGQSVLHPQTRKSIGFLTESPYVYPHLKVREWLEMMGALSGISGSKLHRKALEMLVLFGLEGKQDLLLKNLSKGQLQRAGFAQAMLHSPELLLLDEPMSGMDPFWRNRIKEILLEFKAKGGTLVFSSHIISDVLRLSDQIVFIDAGTIRWQGTMDEFPQDRFDYHVTFKPDSLEAVGKKLAFRALTSYPDGTYGGTITAEEKKMILSLAKADQIELISLVPEYVNIEDWMS